VIPTDLAHLGNTTNMEPLSKEQLVFKLESLKELQISGLISIEDFEREKEFLLRSFSSGCNPSTQILQANIITQAPITALVSAVNMATVNTNDALASEPATLAIDLRDHAVAPIGTQALKVHMDQYGGLMRMNISTRFNGNSVRKKVC
jgi:hypothetical protein